MRRRTGNWANNSRRLLPVGEEGDRVTVDVAQPRPWNASVECEALRHRDRDDGRERSLAGAIRLTHAAVSDQDTTWQPSDTATGTSDIAAPAHALLLRVIMASRGGDASRHG